MIEAENTKEQPGETPQATENDSTIAEPSTLNRQSSPENMEVHHHPHVEKKNFKEYFLEFIMIFLAVTMGFIAESIRENITNSEKEKLFMESLVQDIKADTTIINQNLRSFDQNVILLDSFIYLLTSPAGVTNTNDLYYYGRLATKNYAFYVNTRTLDQIKNTGGFTIIKNNEVVSNIMSYYAVVDKIKELDAGDNEESNDYRRLAVQVFDAGVFNQINSSALNIVSRPVNNPPLRTNDPKLLGDLAAWVHYIKNTRIGIYQYKKEVLEKGENLIEQIEAAYDFDYD